MAYEENARPKAREHKLELSGRAALNVSGVEDVESFDENEIVMNTSQGDLIVRGSGLHIGRINLDAGEIKVEGVIDEISYEEASPAGGFFTKLFG